MRRLTYIGSDSWGRPVYRDGQGNLVVDVDPRPGHEPDLCTKNNNRFDGEPCDPVDGNDIEFDPERVTW